MVIIIGDMSIKENYIDDIKNIIYVKEKDDYLNVGSKLIEALEMLNKNYTFEYIFKTDDDQNITYDNSIIDIINIVKNKNYFYGGKLRSVPTHLPTNHFIDRPELTKKILERATYANGRFTLFSNNSINYYLQNHIKRK